MLQTRFPRFTYEFRWIKARNINVLVVLFVVADNFMVTSKTDINLFKENIIIIQHTCQSIHIYI